MDRFDWWTERLVYLYVLLGLSLLAKLFWTGLFRRYPLFTGFLAADCLQTVVSAFVPYHTDAYFWFYAFSEPVLWLLYVAVVLELYALVLRDYPGLRFLWRWSIQTIMPAAALIALLTSFAKAAPATRSTWGVAPFLIVDRTVSLGLLVFLVLIQVILVWYPIRLSRNTILYCVGYTVFFAANTGALALITQLGFEISAAVNAGWQAVSCACLAVWLLGLNRAGETREIVTASWRPGERERLQEQLMEMNNILSRLSRRI
jgi:hypothetical protein